MSGVAWGEATALAIRTGADRHRGRITDRRGQGVVYLPRPASQTIPGVPLSAQLTASVVDTLEAAEDLVAEWEALADACSAGPFARPLFALTWWRTLGTGSLRITTVRQEGTLVALAPLHRRRVGHLQVVRWLGHGLGTIAEALVHPAHPTAGPALWSAATGRGHVLDLLESREGGSLPQDSHLPGRHHVTSTERDACPVIDVRGDAEVQLAAREQKRVRRTVRVSRRRLEEDGLAFEIKVAHDSATLAELLPDIRRVFDASEAHHPRQHLLAGEWEEFTTGILTDGVAHGGVLALVAYIGGAPAAFDIILLSPQRMSSWIGRFDPEASHYSPGHLLQCAGLDWATAHGYTVIDLLLGDSFYKQLWADRTYATLEVHAGSRSSLATLRTITRLREKVRGG